MTVRIYTSLDAGAPALTGNLYNRVKLILLACLVNGFGSKPGAGWTVGHQSADGNGYSLGNGDGYINFVYQDENAFQAYIMESITDGSTALAAGVNRRSADWFDGSDATSRQWFYQSGGVDSATNPHWVVAADEKTAILICGGGSATADVAGGSSGYAHYFGRYVNSSGLSGAAEFVSLGGANSPGQGSLGEMQSGMCLRNPYTGLIDQGASAGYGAANVTYAGGIISNRGRLVPARLLPVRCGLICFGIGLNGLFGPSNKAYAGQLRGLMSEPALCASRLSDIVPLFGMSNTWQARCQPFSLSGGGQLYAAFPNNADRGFFISTAAADWS